MTTRGTRLITQMYVAGEPLNERDAVLAQIRNPAPRAHASSSRSIRRLNPSPAHWLALSTS
jgi:protocatechuate 3,4-dioxygenase beta subunit